jgi:hypothetical protein
LGKQKAEIEVSVKKVTGVKRFIGNGKMAEGVQE